MSSNAQKILLVEDDQNFGDVLKSYLEMNDYEVHLGKDGVSGMELYRKMKYLLMLHSFLTKKDRTFYLSSYVHKLN